MPRNNGATRKTQRRVDAETRDKISKHVPEGRKAQTHALDPDKYAYNRYGFVMRDVAKLYFRR